MNKYKYYLLTLVTLTAIGAGLFYAKGNRMETLYVGVPGAWGDLLPSLQHTAYADAILSNQYESLVKVGQGGIINPLAAKSWQIEDNFKTYIFTIDTDRKFSNGKNLTAMDFKKTWEHGLTLVPKSSNSSLQDNLYRVEGYENFKQTGELSGLIAKDDSTFIIKFKSPFRTALTNLSDGRMGVFLKDGDNYLGTGPYKIVDQRDDWAEMVRNEHSLEKAEFEKVIFKVVPSDKAVEALNENDIQIYSFAEKTKWDDCAMGTGKISCFQGGASRHLTLIVNGKDNRFFSNNNHRKAFQALIHQGLADGELPQHLTQSTTIDPQIYLPMQKGRLDETEARSIIADGEKYIPAFLEATKKTPLKMYSTKTSIWLIDFVKSKGVTLSEDSGIYTGKRILEMYYKTFESDILAMGLGVFNGDPDGIYHAIGKDGAITSPMSVRESVTKLLEEGRKLLEPTEIDKAYKPVSRAALNDVPFVHLGFINSIMAYRNDIIKVKRELKNRHDDRLITFSPR